MIVLILSMFFGFVMMSSLNLFVTGLALVGLNLCFYIVIAQPKTKAALESAVKYFIVGMLALFFFFFGVFAL